MDSALYTPLGSHSSWFACLNPSYTPISGLEHADTSRSLSFEEWKWAWSVLWTRGTDIELPLTMLSEDSAKRVDGEQQEDKIKHNDQQNADSRRSTSVSVPASPLMLTSCILLISVFYLNLQHGGPQS